MPIPKSISLPLSVTEAKFILRILEQARTDVNVLTPDGEADLKQADKLLNRLLELANIPLADFVAATYPDRKIHVDEEEPTPLPRPSAKVKRSAKA